MSKLGRGLKRGEGRFSIRHIVKNEAIVAILDKKPLRDTCAHLHDGDARRSAIATQHFLTGGF